MNTLNMLKIAQRRQIYDNLICGELVDFLHTRSEEFDVAVAADVLVYMGPYRRCFKPFDAA